MSQQIYGFPFPMPPGIDYMEVSGLDVGFIASLVPDTNDWFSFYMPLPGSINRLTQTIVVHAIEFILQEDHFHQDDHTQVLMAFLSSRGELPAAGAGPARVAARDAFHKAQFARNLYFGQRLITPTDTSLAGPMQWQNDTTEDALYFPPAPLDQTTPTHVHLVTQGVAIDPATQDETPSTFSAFLQFSMVVWFTPRDLSDAEIEFRGRDFGSRSSIRDA